MIKRWLSLSYIYIFLILRTPSLSSRTPGWIPFIYASDWAQIKQLTDEPFDFDVSSVSWTH